MAFLDLLRAYYKAFNGDNKIRAFFNPLNPSVNLTS